MSSYMSLQHRSALHSSLCQRLYTTVARFHCSILLCLYSYCLVSAYTSMQEITIPPKSPDNTPSALRVSTATDVFLCAVLTVPCLNCDKILQAQNVRHHRALHRTLGILQYSAGHHPISLLSLRLRRRSIIAKRMQSKKWSLLELQKINFAYEMVKSHQTSTWPFLSEKPIVCTDEVPLSLRPSRHACIKSLGICQDRNALWKSQMEETYVFNDCYGGRGNAWFIGLFDGYHGMSAAQFASQDLPVLILQQLAMAGHSYALSDKQRAHLSGYKPLFSESIAEDSHIAPLSSATAKSKGTKDHLYRSIHVAFAKAFLKMDRILRLGRNESSKVRWSGCTATTCLLEPAVSQSRNTTEASEGSAERTSEDSMCEMGTLHIANAGDIHVVLCKNGRGYCLTGNHSTSNRNECKRILQTGGTISKNERHGLVEGFIQSTRGLGYHGDPKLKRSIVPIPHTVSVPIDSTCQFLVLASSGFWNVLKRHEVVSISLEMLSLYFTPADTDSRVISSIFHSIHAVDSDERRIDRRSSIMHLLEEFSQQGHKDVKKSVGRLFEELVISKERSRKKEFVKIILDYYSAKKDHNSVWQLMHRLLENVAEKEESKNQIEVVHDDFFSNKKHDTNTSVQSFLEDSLNVRDSKNRTSVVSFSEKPLPENVANDNRTSKEYISEEYLTKEEYNDDRILVTHVAEELSRTEGLNGHYSQENITKESKNQISVSLNFEQSGTSLPERVSTEIPYDETYIMNLGENIEATTQETTAVPQENQYEMLANTISKRLVETAKQAGACDNITVLILLLPGCAKSQSLKEQK
uniref:protein phosphatase 2C-like domain-containing protein 1 isoform X1 n=2 Tax=Pristiophorus japonicus TaxID=55135 RepID=UPI00398E8EB8